MRRVLLLFGAAMAAACSGSQAAAPPAAPGHVPSSVTPAPGTGQLRLRLAGSYPDLHFPLTVAYPGGAAEISSGDEHRVEVPASDTALTRIEVEGWRPVWIRIPVGGEALLTTHPCCGLTFDSNTYDDTLAVCSVGADEVCPDGTEGVPHHLAADPVCGEQRRCVPPATVRVIQQAAASPRVLVHEDGQRYLVSRDPGLPGVAAARNIADMFSFAVEGSPVHQDIAMDAGVAYTIWLDGAEVTRVDAAR